MQDEIKVARHVDGRRDVIVLYKEGNYWVVPRHDDDGGEAYIKAFWPRSRAIRFAQSIAKDRYI